VAHTGFLTSARRVLEKVEIQPSNDESDAD
jgi:hypothetical protein